jgi:hypothetical protein
MYALPPDSIDYASENVVDLCDASTPTQIACLRATFRLELPVKRSSKIYGITRPIQRLLAWPHDLPRDTHVSHDGRQPATQHFNRLLRVTMATEC